MTNWIADVFQSHVGWEMLTDFVDVDHRLGGSPGERAAAEMMRDKLNEIGTRRSRLDEFSIMGWERESTELSLPDSRETVESFALPRSASDAVEGPLIDLGHGTPGDFENANIKGAVVMVASSSPMHYGRVIHRKEKYYQAVEGGAVGFIFRNHIDGDLIRSGGVSGTEQSIGEIPAVGVSKEKGLRLSRRHEGDVVRIDVQATTSETISQNVYAELGPDTEERVIVSAHIDGHDISESAKDNAAGIATVVEVANALSRREDELDTKVEFIGYGAEEIGFIGSAHHRDKIDLNSVKVVIQNDGVARARDLLVHTNGFSPLEELATSTTSRYQHPVEISNQLKMSSDHWRFVERGVPSYLISSVPDQEGMAAYGSSRGIILTPADTLDKIDIRDLRTHSILETELAVRAAGESVTIPHRSIQEIEAQAESEDKREKMDRYKSSRG